MVAAPESTAETDRPASPELFFPAAVFDTGPVLETAPVEPHEAEPPTPTNLEHQRSIGNQVQSDLDALFGPEAMFAPEAPPEPNTMEPQEDAALASQLPDVDIVNTRADPQAGDPQQPPEPAPAAAEAAAPPAPVYENDVLSAAWESAVTSPIPAEPLDVPVPSMWRAPHAPGETPAAEPLEPADAEPADFLLEPLPAIVSSPEPTGGPQSASVAQRDHRDEIKDVEQDIEAELFAAPPMFETPPPVIHAVEAPPQPVAAMPAPARRQARPLLQPRQARPCRPGWRPAPCRALPITIPSPR